MPRVVVTSEPLQPWQLLASYEKGVNAHSPGSTGACATFIGTMRDMNQGDGVTGMTLEYYPGMTERILEQLLSEAVARWQLTDALIEHRVGRLEPEQPIVVVAVWSAHRREAFEACRAIMETLKSEAPFWKREELKTGESRWVESNSDGY